MAQKEQPVQSVGTSENITTQTPFLLIFFEFFIKPLGHAETQSMQPLHLISLIFIFAILPR